MRYKVTLGLLLFAAMGAGIVVAQNEPNGMVCVPAHVNPENPSCPGACEVKKITNDDGTFLKWQCTNGTCTPAGVNATAVPGVCDPKEETNCTSGLLVNINVPVGSCPGCPDVSSNDEDVQPKDCNCGAWKANNPPQFATLSKVANCSTP